MADELDRLKQIRDRPRRAKPEKAPEPTITVSMPPEPGPKRPSIRAAKEKLDRAAESPWVKLLLALAVGGAGGEAHRTFTALGVASKTDLEAQKKQHDKDVQKLNQRIASLEAVVKENKEGDEQDHRTLYLTSRYLYFVLPRLGVLVTLPPGVELHRMDFHPAPVPRGPLGPNDAKPIQPAETLPIPPER